jgi:cysteine desulfurase
MSSTATWRRDVIYLDHNATTPVDEEVRETITTALAAFGNPSSSHKFGITARACIENARRQVAELIGCAASEIVFTSGGTESNNLAILGIAARSGKGHVITSAIEHPSILRPVRWLQERGFEVTVLPVDSSGLVYPDDVRNEIRENTILITVMHANNETGTLQPIRDIGLIARERNVPFHTDAAQSVGKMAVSVSGLSVDLLTVVSHKFYGPKGVGALYIRGFGEGPAAHVPAPITFGAGHEHGLRPGTENTPCIAGLGKACEIALRDAEERSSHAAALRDTLHRLLEDRLDVELNGHAIERLPNTLNISIGGIIAEDLVDALRDSVALSSGSACHAGVRAPSPVLKAMGTPDERALSSVRLTVGKDNTVQEIHTAAELIVRAVLHVRSKTQPG